ncbi:MAG: PQQ-binding-like beta-propeller repeat protein, partial [Planctomycetes bacterium]|nr:PQQ-binding-like beta-propeller repeat protein [Planctomycetota bacterium]
MNSPAMERFAATGRRTAVLLLGLGLPGGLAAQAPHREVVRPVDFATSQDDNLFSLQRSQEQIHAYETALQELDRGEHQAAVERLHRLLQADTGGVVPVGPGRYVGLRVAVVVAMANLPAAAQQAYEDLVRREAGALRAPLAHLSPEQLLLAAERFPAAELGRAARLRLGDLALERGDGLEAAGHYRQALDATTIGSRDELRVFQRLQQAQVLCDPQLARAEASLGQLDAVGDDLLQVLPTTTGVEPVTNLGGSGGGAAPNQAPTGSLTTIWSDEVTAPFFDRSESGQHAMHAVGGLDGIYVNTGHAVLALDPLRRSRAWSTISPMRDETHDYRDSCNNDTVLACSIDDDLVVAALQVPDRSVNVDFNGGLRIMWKIPQRRLYAFDRRSGKLVWQHFDELDGPRTRRFKGHDSCGNPLLLGDTVYAPTHDRPGAIQFCVAAYEARTGQPKWRRLICSSQQDVNMFGNAQADFTASPLRHAGGVLFGASNLGVVYALDAATGRVRWITAYEVVRMPRVSMHRQVERTVYFANNPPVVFDGVVCSTPLDSQFVLAHDVETGRPLWRLASEATIAGTDHHVQWLCGVLGSEFVLAGAGCVAVAPRPLGDNSGQPAARSLVAPDQLVVRRERGQARPALTADRLWVPRPDRLLAFDATGALVETVRLPRWQPGNLLLVGGLVVSLRQRSCDVIADPAGLLDRFEAKVEATPDDPEALLRLASLRRALLPEDATSEQMAPVLAVYRRGVAACKKAGLPDQHPTHLALRSELYEHAFRQARTSLAAGRA